VQGLFALGAITVGEYTCPMPSPVRFAIVRKLLESKGYRLDRISGSHHVFVKPASRT
jgi:hypothetical protein